jgi:hypothetical protein
MGRPTTSDNLRIGLVLGSSTLPPPGCVIHHTYDAKNIHQTYILVSDTPGKKMIS